MLSPRCKHEQRFRLRVEILPGIEQQRPQGLPNLGSAGFSGDARDNAAFAQKRVDPGKLGTFACTIQTLERNEFAAHQRLPER
jgi:hypothetical protein